MSKITIEEITGPMSFAIFTNPVRTNCKHTFEKKELDDWRGKCARMNQAEQLKEIDQRKDIRFTCPTCRIPIKQITPDQQMKNLIASFKQEAVFLAQAGDTQSVEMLIKQLDDQINLTLNANNETALMIAAKHGQANACTQLIEAGAKITLRVLKITSPDAQIAFRFNKEKLNAWVSKTGKKYKATRNKEAGQNNKKTHRIHKGCVFSIPCLPKTNAVDAFIAFSLNPSADSLQDLKDTHWSALTSGRVYNELFAPYILMSGTEPRCLECMEDTWFRNQESVLEKSAGYQLI